MINNTKELMNTLPDIAMELRDNFNTFIRNIKTSKWPSDIKESIFKEINNGTYFAERVAMDTLKNYLWELQNCNCCFRPYNCNGNSLLFN